MSSKFSDWEHFPLHILEELKAKNLLPFVAAEESTCNRLICYLYLNERFRPLVGWGNILQVHIFPAVDRRPITNEAGNVAISAVEDIPLLKGYKWEGDWTVVIEEGVTDEDGYQYAYAWRNFKAQKTTSSGEQFSSFVRRQRLRRVMVVDVDAVSKLLPYDLCSRVSLVADTGQRIAGAIPGFEVTFLVDNDTHETGWIGPPHWFKDFSLSLTHIQRTRAVGFRIVKPSKSFFSSSPCKAFTIGEIIDLSAQQKTPPVMTLMQDKGFALMAQWRILENVLFEVQNLHRTYSEGQLSTMVFSEGRMSQRLKEKIIMISLNSGSSCGGLLRDMTSLLSETQGQVDDYDLIEILDDLNQMQGSKKEFDKLVSLLRGAELADEIDRVLYPYSLFIFSHFAPMPHFEISSQNIDLIERLFKEQERNAQWFRQQPSCLPYLMKSYLGYWMHESKVAQRAYPFRLDLFLREDSLCFGIIFDNFYDYILVLKYLSVLRYNRLSTSDSLSLQRNLEGVSCTVFVDGHMYEKALIGVDLQEECVEIDVVSVISGSGNHPLFPARILFEFIDGMEVSHSHFVSMSHLLELRLLSATSMSLQSNNDYTCWIDVEVADGQHYTAEFTMTHELGATQPATGNIDRTIRILLPASIQTDSYEAFIRFSLSAEQCAPQRTQSLRGSPGLRLKDDHASVPFDRKLSLAFPSPTPSFMASSSVNNNSTPPKTPQNTLKMGSAMLPTVSLDPHQEQELQLYLDKQAYEIRLFLNQVQWIDERIVCMNLNIYCILYLSDRDGNVISIAGSEGQSQTSSSLFRRAASSAQPAFRTGYLQRTGLITAGGGYAWDNAEIILDSRRYSMIDHAQFVTVEFWAVSGGESHGIDKYVGEAYVPLLRSVSDFPPRAFSCAIHAGQCNTGNNEQFLAAGPVAKHLYTLGTLKVKLSFAMLDGSNNISPSSSAKSRAVRSYIKLTSSVRPLQATDCAWPCQILSPSEKKAEPDLYQLSIGQEGIHFRANGDLSLFSSQDRISVMEECAERISVTSSTLHLLIPYQQIDANDLCVVTSSILLIGLQLKRKFTTKDASPVGHKVVFKTIKFEVVVGPCLAEELHASIRNKLATLPMRNYLSSHLRAADRDQEESFPQLVKMLEDHIYETTIHIERNAAAEEQLLGRSSDHLQSVSKSISVSFGKDDPGQSLMPEVLRLLEAALRNPATKLLHLKLATLRVYLWFLLEQSTHLLASEKHYLEASWILFDDNGSDLKSAFYDQNEMDTLFFRIGENMRRLEQDVRHLIFRHLRSANPDCSEQLSHIIHARYINIVCMLLEAMDYTEKQQQQRQPPALDGEEDSAAHRSRNNPQKRRDLIKFIITNDEIFETYLNALLRSHNYRFSTRPLLSLCIDFNVLLDQFAMILDQSLLMWNTRTLKHFMSRKETSTTTLPWDITTISDLKGREIYISNIPETIQLQLNVEIGLKKIVPAANILNHSDESLQRIDGMNKKISIAIIRSYMALAAEYERTLDGSIFQPQAVRVSQSAGSGRKSNMSLLHDEGDDEKDELLCFLASVLNDCHRIRATHIPQTIELFTIDHHHYRGAQSHNVYQRLSFFSTRESVLESQLIDDVSGDPKHINTLSFSNCVKAMANVSRKAANILSNHIFFHSSLYPFFLPKLDALLHARLQSFVLGGGAGNRDSSLRRSFSFGGNAAQGAQRLSVSAEHSPLAVIKATVTEFLLFISQHLSFENIEALFYLCIFKVIVRYLLALRDYHALREKALKKTSTRYRGTQEDGNQDVDQRPGDDMIMVWKQDLRTILLLHSEVKEKLVSLYATTNHERSSGGFHVGDENEDAGELLIHQTSAEEEEGSQGGRDRNRESEKLKKVSDPQESKYAIASVALLNKVSTCIMMTIANDWPADRDPIAPFLLHNFNVVLPEYDADSRKYHAKLEQFLSFDSAFTHFVPPRQLLDQDHIRLCTIEIENFACANAKRRRSLFMKVHFNKQTYTTALQQGGGPLVQWKDKFVINKTLISNVKTLTIELYSFRLGVFKVLREQLVGVVCINLIDLVRGEDAAAASTTTADKTSAPPSTLNIPPQPALATAQKDADARSESRFSVHTQAKANTEWLQQRLQSADVIHTAWYNLQRPHRLLLRGRESPGGGGGGGFRRGSGNRLRRAPASQGEGGVTYLNSLSTQIAKGPRAEDLPQVRVSIKVSYEQQSTEARSEA